MSDLIDRQAAIEKRSPQERLIIAKTLIESVLDDLPSAQPERKKGEWISLDDFRGKYNENGFICSECCEHSDYEENFCPNCGASMQDDFSEHMNPPT